MRMKSPLQSFCIASNTLGVNAPMKVPSWALLNGMLEKMLMSCIHRLQTMTTRPGIPFTSLQHSFPEAPFTKNLGHIRRRSVLWYDNAANFLKNNGSYTTTASFCVLLIKERMKNEEIKQLTWGFSFLFSKTRTSWPALLNAYAAAKPERSRIPVSPTVSYILQNIPARPPPTTTHLRMTPGFCDMLIFS